MEIKCSGEFIEDLLKFLQENKANEYVFKLDEDSFYDEIDFVFGKLRISDVEKEEKEENSYGDKYTFRFKCNKETEKALIKLIGGVKSLGDGGHSFTVRINGKSIGYDGDGSDYITSINGKQIKKKEFNSYHMCDYESKNEINEIIKLTIDSINEINNMQKRRTI